MRLEPLASLRCLADRRPGLLVAPALLIAANLGAITARQGPTVTTRTSAIAHRHDMARVPLRALSGPASEPSGDDADVDLRSLLGPRAVDQLGRAIAESPHGRAAPPAPAVTEVPEVPVTDAGPVPGEPPQPAPPPVPADSVWASMASCESGGDWGVDSGNGYYGGLQFSEDSWRNVGGDGLPHEHPPDHQIAMAERLLSRQGWAAWPACARRLGLL